MIVWVGPRGELPGSSDALTPDERALLDALGFAGARAREWIAGRVAVRRAIARSGSVLADASGAPTCEGWSVSISHDGDWVAVAADRVARVAVDVCCISRAERAERILARLGVRAEDPCLAWAALECALKLRGRGVWSLLDGALAVTDGRVSWIGGDVDVQSRVHPDYRLAWAVA